jgi:hypothetical protein
MRIGHGVVDKRVTDPLAAAVAVFRPPTGRCLRLATITSSGNFTGARALSFGL